MEDNHPCNGSDVGIKPVTSGPDEKILRSKVTQFSQGAAFSFSPIVGHRGRDIPPHLLWYLPMVIAELKSYYQKHRGQSGNYPYNGIGHQLPKGDIGRCFALKNIVSLKATRHPGEEDSRVTSILIITSSPQR
jgi:hypothetical protein